MSTPGSGRLELHAHFSIQREGDQGAYDALMELIDRLNQVANLPQCEADLRISVDGRIAGDRPAEHAAEDLAALLAQPRPAGPAALA
ncbi:MAG: hypothetical protein KGJ43_08825 [Acidobacteriota bacterium]|nr:hypothetical protein [Acidobacteriota bacterium]